MTELNIVTESKQYTVNEGGEVDIILTDTANFYADGSSPSKHFLVRPAGDKPGDLNKVLLLVKEEAIDYFRGEAEKISKRKVIEVGMGKAEIPEVIFNGDPKKYIKTIKKGESNEELIIKDTIVVTPYNPGVPDAIIYHVAAYIMQPTEGRGAALQVNVLWNKNSGYAKLKELLILEYRARKIPASAWIEGEIKTAIGTDIPN
jgi:hypothetical protein